MITLYPTIATDVDAKIVAYDTSALCKSSMAAVTTDTDVVVTSGVFKPVNGVVRRFSESVHPVFDK